MKIVTVIGARPQFIKASIISQKLSRASNIQEVIVHTGQHYDQGMSNVFFEELGIPNPQYNLGIGSASHGQQTGHMLGSIEEVLLNESPDLVVVYGDTNSTLAGAIAAAKLHISIAHIEAGLRSFNRQMPEEINRVLTDHASDILLTPTKLASRNLIKEGIEKAQIFEVGDVMYDVALTFAEKADQKSKILENLNLQSNSFILATIHRAENTDDSKRLEYIFTALCQISETTEIVLPLHPRTKKALQSSGLLSKVSNSLRVIDPVGYLDMVALEKNAQLILTDSGGVQKEAYFYQVPCVVLRDETEWQELIELGWNKLVPPNSIKTIQTGILQHLSMDVNQLSFPTVYGDGHSAKKIVDILSKSVG